MKDYGISTSMMMGNGGETLERIAPDPLLEKILVQNERILAMNEKILEQLSYPKFIIKESK